MVEEEARGKAKYSVAVLSADKEVEVTRRKAKRTGSFIVIVCVCVRVHARGWIREERQSRVGKVRQECGKEKGEGEVTGCQNSTC